VAPVRILDWCALRGRLGVTGQEARAHSGMATPRPWHERAMARTTPALLGLFSRVPLWAGRVAHAHPLPVSHAGWDPKALPTLATAIAIVRQHWWPSTQFYRSPTKADLVEIPCARPNRLTETLCSAA
jgi:hypothetical protein